MREHWCQFCLIPALGRGRRLNSSHLFSMKYSIRLTTARRNHENNSLYDNSKPSLSFGLIFMEFRSNDSKHDVGHDITRIYRRRSNKRTSFEGPRILNRTGDLAFSVAAAILRNTFNQDLLNAKTSYNFKTGLRNYAINTQDIDVFIADQDCQMDSVYRTNVFD